MTINLQNGILYSQSRRDGVSLKENVHIVKKAKRRKMNPKPLTIVCGLLALALGLGLGACGKLHPAPEIDVVNVNPLSVAISDTTTDSSVLVTFVNRNGVDAVITAMQETTYRQDVLVTRYSPAKLSFFINAHVREDTTGGISGSALEIKYSKAVKKGSQGLIGLTSKIIFYGEDAYGNGKTFSDSIAFSYN